jgi:hypothetical protein
LSRFLSLAIQLWGICLLLLCGFLIWEIWTRGAANAFSLPSLLWYGRNALYAAGLSAFIAAASWFAEWLERKRG